MVHSGWVLVIYLHADGPETSPSYFFRLKRQPHAHDLERVREEDARHTCQGARKESAERGFVGFGGDEDGADLLVGEEFDGRVGEDAEEGCGVTAEQTADAGLPVDVPHGSHDAEPGAGVFGELGVGGLKEDFDAVEGAHDGFRLKLRDISIVLDGW